ncbi:SET domain-containing protein-lysine N-methyltransferase, partial [Burkholderia pseudomallei]|nr:SET domain-containing protein-lysine N-methyltransferase [Burkholderia pseudomallei]MBF3728070.1 SET domain-containing protein-lysine N-methyltransferase [Burkholderia pseudomallei]
WITGAKELPNDSGQTLLAGLRAAEIA